MVFLVLDYLENHVRVDQIDVLFEGEAPERLYDLDLLPHTHLAADTFYVEFEGLS